MAVDGKLGNAERDIFAHSYAADAAFHTSDGNGEAVVKGKSDLFIRAGVVEMLYRYVMALLVKADKPREGYGILAVLVAIE